MKLDKPDWCPIDVWDAAVAQDKEIANSIIDRTAKQEDFDMPVLLARAIIQARSQAFDECAKIAENYRTNMAFWMGLDLETARQATEIAGHDISQAIRQHSQKGKS